MQDLITKQEQATLQILYSEVPVNPGDPFIEIRQWQTAVGEQTELIVEHGNLDEAGELQTQCQVMPFFLSVREVLAEIKM